MSATAETGSARLADLLRQARFEVLPLEGIEDEVRAHLPTEVKVTVTASPRRGLDATLDLTERLTAAGYSTVLQPGAEYRTTTIYRFSVAG